MGKSCCGNHAKMPRRHFLGALGTTVAGAAALSSRGVLASRPTAGQASARKRGTATVRGAFVYPSTESLRKAGYYSWPGAGFDAEGHHRRYADGITAIARRLDMRIAMNEKPLHDAASVTRFIKEVKDQPPDGLLLIPLKKHDWDSVIRIVDESGTPTVAFTTLGVLRNIEINKLSRRPGVHVISSLDNLDALERGMRMIKTARWMRESRIVSLAGSATKDTIVQNLGTQVWGLPRERFAEEFRRTKATTEVRDIARTYLKNARKVVEPSDADVLDAAKTYVACKRILDREQGDAIMIECLGGIRERRFAPPCMGFMSLRDEGIAAGCENDLNATLTLMLLQQLFDRPGFMQNCSSETEKNHYVGAHCTCPTKLNGPSGPSEPYILRNHAEAGVGVAPQVLWRTGQEVTMTRYFAGEKPEMIVYSGKVVRCYNTPPAGGCRTNVELTINEVEDVGDVKGNHMTIIYGNYAKQLRVFCQLYGITVVT